MLSIFDWFGYRLTMEERYRLIKNAGFLEVMILWGHTRGRGEDFREAPGIARAAGLKVENIHAPTHLQHYLWEDSPSGEEAAACYARCLQDCHDQEIPTLVLHLPGNDTPPSPLALDRLKALVEKAEALEINIALENLMDTESLDWAFSQIDSPRLGFCYDCCHHYNEVPEEDLMGRYGHRLMAMHLHDNSGSSRSYCIQHRLPFDGDIPWKAVMGQIAASGYRGATAIEPIYWDYQELPPDVFLYRAFEKAKRLDAMRRQA